jgi:hypothetical protein
VRHIEAMKLVSELAIRGTKMVSMPQQTLKVLEEPVCAKARLSRMLFQRL